MVHEDISVTPGPHVTVAMEGGIQDGRERVHEGWHLDGHGRGDGSVEEDLGEFPYSSSKLGLSNDSSV